MSVIKYPTNSPYSSTSQTSWHIGRMVWKPVLPDSGDLPYTLSERHTNRPDKLSYELYGTPNYWWIFCVRNPFLRAEPIWGFVGGLTIMVPSAQHLRNTVGG